MGKKIKILIVDDISINRQILSALFDTEYEILEADDGLTALGVLSENEVDIIILDIMMPGMGGLEFLQQIKQVPKYKNISVIISTEAGSTENEIRALELGADNFIVKPYNPVIIKNRVKNIVENYITSRIALKKNAEEMERRFCEFADVVPGGACILKKTDQYRVFYSNNALFKMLGYSQKEALLLKNTDVFSYISADDYKPVRSVLEKDVMHGGNVSCGTKLLCKDGSLVETEMSVRMAVYENVRFYYVVLINLTKSRRKEEILKKELSKYRFRASRDALTGIYNQETFFSETRKLVEKYPGERFVIGEWNIDRFKAINELFGSHAGDQIICAFADHLQRTYIEKCTYGRMESDHFVTCCPESFLEERSPEVEALLNGQMSWHTLNHPISLHAGFYRVEQGERDVAIMCDRAGMALQQIKDSFIQREKYFNDDLLEALVKEQQMMRDADAALNNKEFFVMYQPIIDVKTKKIVAAEALVRWKKRTGEIVSPGEFIPIFERNGFISKLDMYVWEEVCRYQSHRKAVGKKLVPISVNLSRIDFYNTNLYQDILGLLKKYDLVTDCLKLEITESAYMDQPQELMTTIQQFQKTGFKILMDDFGSGFSSLNMLKDVSVDILKIDMRFMESLETSDRAGNILFSIIQMAKGIHMEVIAEGVETENQYELLVSMDCDGVQGYYFYKPLMEEEIGRKLDEEALEKPLTRAVGQKSILVVDDVEMERELLCRIIEGDYHVLTAASVDRAMEILKREFANIALVITDIIMPDKNGFVLLKQMKKMMFFSSIPVLMMTADGEYENVEKAISMGALDVIGKPFDAPILRQRLKNILKISERETVSREIHALKENVVLRKQLDSLLEDSVAGIARVRLCHDEPYAIKEVVYVNDRFLYFHQIQEPEALNRKALYQLMKNTLSGDLEALGKKFEKAVKTHEKFVGGEYHLEGDNGFYKNMYASCTIRYYQEEILLDLLVMECRTGVEYQLDRSMQAFSELLGVQTGLGAWRYYPIDDVIEYYTKNSDGSFTKKILKNSRENVIGAPIFIEKDRGKMKRVFEKLAQGEERIQEEFNIYPLSTVLIPMYWIRFTMVRIDMPDRDNITYLGMAEDITEDVKSKERKWREQQYKEIFSKDAEFFVEADLTDNNFISEESLQQFPDHKKYADPSYDILLEDFLKTVSEEDIGRCRSMLAREKLLAWYEEGEREVKFDFLSDVNEPQIYEWYTSDMFLVKNSEDGHIYTSWQIKNVQHEKQRLNNMKRLTEQDTMTGLYNRIMIEKSMDLTLAESTQKNSLSAFFMIDVDNFKAVNDNFGHDFGDNVNVRQTPSTDGEVLVKCNTGDSFTRYEETDDGWSRVDYNGEDAYISSDFLKVSTEEEIAAAKEEAEKEAAEKEAAAAEAAETADTTTDTTAADTAAAEAAAAVQAQADALAAAQAQAAAQAAALAAAQAAAGHSFTDKNGTTTVFTTEQWNYFLSYWDYTGQAEEMISHHTCAELQTLYNNTH